jgi:hypothetical protein
MGTEAHAHSAWDETPKSLVPTVRRLYTASAVPRWTDTKGALLPWNPASEIALSNTIARPPAAPARTAFRRAQIRVGAWRITT